MTSKKESILIITNDLKLNQTFSNRYFSFIKALKSNSYEEVCCLGIDFPFNPHPINNLKKTSYPIALGQNIVSISPKHLNFVQKLLVFCDKNNLPFKLKKTLLALHIIIFRIDQWYVSLKDFRNLENIPTLIISGGCGGIIKSSYNLAKKHNSKLILDYRDPWNFGYNLLETNKIVSRFKRLFTLNKELKYLKV
jgi:hypothetical protein